MLSLKFIFDPLGAVEKFYFYPLTPQGGNLKPLITRKSPLGVPIAIGIGVDLRKLTFETPSLNY